MHRRARDGTRTRDLPADNRGLWPLSYTRLLNYAGYPPVPDSCIFLAFAPALVGET